MALRSRLIAYGIDRRRPSWRASRLDIVKSRMEIEEPLICLAVDRPAKLHTRSMRSIVT